MNAFHADRADAVAGYRACLRDDSTFAAWTLEELTATAKSGGARPWIDALVDRYLDFDKLERATPG